ncbi:MAG: hypothetical protein M1823_006332, partial [Watsoniomyces obsoletus]
LNRELEEVRRQRRIAALRKTLEEERRALAPGEVPPAGEVLPERRPAEPRPRSDTLEIAIPTAKRSRTMADESKPRVVDAEPFRGRTQRELTDFIRRCERVFAIREVTYAADREKILLATSYLQGETQDAWYPKEREDSPDNATSWEEFLTFLRNALQPESLRRTDVHHRYRTAKQGAVQTVQAFVAYLDELEQYMDPYTERQRAFTLLDGLHGQQDGLPRNQHRGGPEGKASKHGRSAAGPGRRARGCTPDDPAARLLATRELWGQGGQRPKRRRMLAVRESGAHQEGLPEGRRKGPGGSPKRQGPVDVVAVVLGRTKQEQIGMTVTVRGKDGWIPLRGILDTGATRTFISQLRVKELGLDREDERPPRVATLGGDVLATYAFHSAPMRLKDSEGRCQTVTGRMIAANITGYDLILGNDWLKRFCKAI